MFQFTHKSIVVFKFLLFITIFCLIQIILYQYSENIQIENEFNQNIMNTVINNIPVEEKADIWQIEIPTIGLIAEISEGTTQDILNQYVGHFTQTSKTVGNIGLAAHNRGYEVNYFEKLKLLKEGDEITYRYNAYENTYIVTDNFIIKDTDWEHLEATEENQITLITCVENTPEFRRCVKAIEKEQEMY